VVTFGADCINAAESVDRPVAPLTVDMESGGNVGGGGRGRGE
jgi:hypothetical protein